MKRKILNSFIVIGLMILTSCGTTKFESGLQGLQLGMTKQEVISTLGKNYRILGSGTSPDGDIETWSYRESNILYSDSNERIIVNFLDGKLDEWHREFLPPPPPTSTNDKQNSK